MTEPLTPERETEIRRMRDHVHRAASTGNATPRELNLLDDIDDLLAEVGRLRTPKCPKGEPRADDEGKRED